MNTRIAPSTDADTELLPPAGGSWIRDADGGLTPADEATAKGAGLDWPAATPTATPASKAVKADQAKE